MTGCDIATPTIVYAWTDNFEKFNSLKLPGRVCNWTPDKVTTMLKNDGNEWERRVHSKTVEQSGVLVIVQFFEERPIEKKS
jgi:hypothetical protein